MRNMNNSQLLYKISDLQYSIRRKQAEYNAVLKTNDLERIRTKEEALAVLQAELDASISAFNTIPLAEPEHQPVKPKKTWRWLRFFQVKAATRNIK